MLNYVIIIGSTAIFTFILFICATLYTDFLYKRLAQTVQRLDKGIPIFEKKRKQNLASEEMRIKMIKKDGNV